MTLPDLIEIVPLPGPVRAEVTVPGSKSITNRALILAALGDGETKLRGALWSEDTQVMADGLARLGFPVTIAPDPDETCNRTITVRGHGGKIPRAGTAEQPLDLFVGNAGTAARFLAAMVCLGGGACRLSGVPRMHERPQAALFAALRQLGYRVDSPNDRLPAVIHGEPRGAHLWARHASVSIADSSQFASALLLSAPAGGWKVQVTGHDAEEAPYVTMTERLITGFPAHGGEVLIEPDASSGSYFWAGGWLQVASRRSRAADVGTGILRYDTDFLPTVQEQRKVLPVHVRRWPDSGWQVDAAFPRYLPLPSKVSRSRDLGDSIMTAVVLAPFAAASVSFHDLGRLRVQECERVAALRTELTRCGAKVVETGNTLEVFPSELHGAEIETYQDHRMAMCFATLGLKVPGIKIRNPACVRKTFPNFFQKLAAPPAHGLGAVILDARTRQPLTHDDLFAD